MGYQQAARLDDLPVGGAVRVEVDGTPVALVRVDQATVKAVHDVCSHQHYPLSDGEVDLDDGTIECAKHGSTFDLDRGDPQSLPATAPVPVYACRVGDDGTVEVDLDAPLNDAEEPAH